MIKLFIVVIMQILTLRKPIKIDKNKLIVVAVRTPYDINVLDVPTYVCAYEATVLSFKALVKYLTGEIEAKGILPVSVK